MVTSLYKEFLSVSKHPYQNKKHKTKKERPFKKKFFTVCIFYRILNTKLNYIHKFKYSFELGTNT